MEKIHRTSFVFACWIANKSLPEQFKQSFVEALDYGVGRLDLSLEEKGMNFPSSINQKILDRNN